MSSKSKLPPAKTKATFMQKIQDAAQNNGIPIRTTESQKWYYDKVKNVRNLDRKKLLTDPLLKARKAPLIGRMFMFIYDPKHKADLPFYDKFPLIFMVGPAKGGFYGINLHYLPPMIRGLFFDKLMSLASNKFFNSHTRLLITYELLKGASKFEAFKPCFKHYLFDHVKSFPMEVDPPEWELALFMPTDDFVFKTRQTIWGYAKKSLGL